MCTRGEPGIFSECGSLGKGLGLVFSSWSIPEEVHVTVTMMYLHCGMRVSWDYTILEYSLTIYIHGNKNNNILCWVRNRPKTNLSSVISNKCVRVYVLTWAHMSHVNAGNVCQEMTRVGVVIIAHLFVYLFSYLQKPSQIHIQYFRHHCLLTSKHWCLIRSNPISGDCPFPFKFKECKFTIGTLQRPSERSYQVTWSHFIS